MLILMIPRLTFSILYLWKKRSSLSGYTEKKRRKGLRVLACSSTRPVALWRRHLCAVRVAADGPRLCVHAGVSWPDQAVDFLAGGASVSGNSSPANAMGTSALSTSAPGPVAALSCIRDGGAVRRRHDCSAAVQRRRRRRAWRRRQRWGEGGAPRQPTTRGRRQHERRRSRANAARPDGCAVAGNATVLVIAVAGAPQLCPRAVAARPGDPAPRVLAGGRAGHRAGRHVARLPPRPPP